MSDKKDGIHIVMNDHSKIENSLLIGKVVYQYDPNKFIEKKYKDLTLQIQEAVANKEFTSKASETDINDIKNKMNEINAENKSIKERLDGLQFISGVFENVTSSLIATGIIVVIGNFIKSLN